VEQAAPEPKAQTPPQRAGFGWRVAGAFVRRREASILLVALGLILYFSVRTDAFFGRDNARVIAEFSAPLMIIAAGQVMLLICGEIDLSVGNVFAFSAWIFYFANTSWNLPLIPAVIVGLLSGAVVGLTNGLITVFLGVPSFITTLGMIFLLNGITLNISHGFPVETPGGLEGTFFRFFGGSPYAGFYWAIGVVVVMSILLTSTRWGLHTVATGGNAVGASESGVNVRAIKVGNFVMCSMLGALAGMLEAVRITSIQPLQGGTSVMFYAVAAAVIGGTSLFGGSGTVIGAALGVFVLAILSLGFTLQGISAFTFDLVLGVAIIASMALNVTLERIRQSGRLGRLS
jgi:simple sugar transport system permease protein